MTLFASAAAVCMIVCHGGPADHFATFVESLPQEMGAIEIYASGPALKKLQERGAPIKLAFSVDDICPEEQDKLAEKIAKECSKATVVITVDQWIQTVEAFLKDATSQELGKKAPQATIYQKLGIRSDWLRALEETLFPMESFRAAH